MTILPLKKGTWVWIFGCLLLAGWVLAQGTAWAADAREIDVSVDVALDNFKKEVGGAQEFLSGAKGYLVFPKVMKAGIGIGGEYGEGSLRIGGRTVAYYSTAAASIGLQLGVQKKSIILVFLTDGSLEKFRRSEGWEVGVDGSVALVTVGAGGRRAFDKDIPRLQVAMHNRAIVGILNGAGKDFYHLSRLFRRLRRTFRQPPEAASMDKLQGEIRAPVVFANFVYLHDIGVL